MNGDSMYYVYLLRSVKNPVEIYIGYTENIGGRLKAHNKGDCSHTKKFKPWYLETYLSFSKKQIAIDFERYLKTHSGRAFLSKRLI